MMLRIARKLPFAAPPTQFEATMQPMDPAVRPSAVLGRGLGEHAQGPFKVRTGLSLLAMLMALFTAMTQTAAGQTARVAGQLTTFGASLTSAVGSAVDASQNVYVVTSAGSVYKESFDSSAGTYTESLLFTTASGSGSGIAVDSTGATLYVGTGSAHTVAAYTSSGSGYALANTFTGFSGATVPAVDASGNVYIADAARGVLYKETLAGTAFSQASIATGLLLPQYLAVDRSGNLFVNSGTTQVYKVSGSGTSYTKTALTISGLSSVAGIAVDTAGNLFLQTGTDLVEAVPNGGRYFGSPFYQYAGQAVSVDALGNVYLLSSTQSSGTKLTAGSGYLNFGSVGPGAPVSMTVAFTLTSSASGTLGTPTVVTQGLTGYDFTLGSGSTCPGAPIVAGASCTVVVQFKPQASGSRLGAVDLTVSGAGSIASAFLGGVGFTPVAVYQSVTLLNTISTSLSSGRGLTVDPAGNVFVANSTAAQILKFPAGSTTPVVFNTTNTCNPVGTAVDGQGNVFYTCNGETNMYEIVGGSGPTVQIPVGYATDDHLSVDAAGNLYPTSYNNPSNLFLKVAAGTHAVTVLAAAPAAARFVAAVTDAAGNTFAPDYNNGILYELPAGSNTLITLYSGAPLIAPHAIAEDAAGNLYVTTTTPNTAGSGTSNLLRFPAGNYTAKPATIAVPGADSLFITPNGNFYTIYNNTTLAVYTRSVFSLAFPATVVGQTSATQTVTLENDGTAPLTLSPPSSGSNPSLSTNFTFDPSSTCPELNSSSAPAALAAGSSCTDVLQFSPQQAGSISGSMITTDNSANVAGSTQIIKLSGNATAGTPTVNVTNASGTLGQPVTLSATVSGGGVAPSGGVTFVVGSGNPVTATCTASANTETCTASYPTATALTAGGNTITATFAGDSNYTAATGSGTLTLAPAPTTSTLTTSLNPSTFGQPITLSGTVASSYGTPTGAVTFSDGSTVLGTAPLNSTGKATFTTSTLGVGTHPITMTYNGAQSFVLSMSATLSQVVNKATGYGNNLSSSNTTPSFGSSVTFTDTFAVLGGVAPTGTVTFYNGGTAIGTGTINGSGVAVLTTTTLPVGTDKITAVYPGDGNYTTSTAGPLTESVSKASVLSNLTTSNANPMFGTSVTLTETVPVVGGVAPGGTVTFYNGTVVLGTGALNASGIATLTTAALPVGTDTVTAVFAGDSNYNSTTSNAVTETVTKASGYSDVLATSNATPAFGTSVTFTTTLGTVGGLYPTGSVTFYNGTTAIGTGVISSTGVATLTTSALPIGSDAITSVYAGDANFSNSTSNIITETVGKAAVSSDVLTSSNSTPNFGSSVTLTDTLAPVNGSYPSGTITFYNGTTAIGTGTLSATGVATLSTSALPVGADAITANFAGDANFNAAVSNKITETVAKANVPSDALTTSNATPGFGSSVTLTDTLAALNGAFPTGTVTFYNGTTAIGTGTLNAAGVATLSTSALPVGTDTMTAVYGGDTTFNNATSNALTETVAKTTGYSNVLSTSNASPSFGSTVTLTDTLPSVNGSFPTGTVTFYNGTTAIGTGTISATGVATLSTGALPVGTDTITAVYGGDGTFSGSTSNAITETVSKAAVASNLLATSNASPAFGSSVTLTDTLAPLGSTYPSGTVTFFNGTTAIGTGTISATGVATLSTSALPVGSDTITAVFGGDATFSNSTSNAVTENVGKASGYSDVLSTSNATPAFGSNVTLTDTIATVNGVVPTGTVTFYNGTTALGTGTLNSSGVAMLTTGSLPPGTDTITAVYGGDQTFAAATSNAVTETVAKATGYGDALASSNASPAFGASVTFTNTLAAVTGVYPTGTVTFLNGTTTLGTGTLSATGVATLTTSALPAGTDTITATYGGDATFAPATSNQLTETVGKASGYADVLTTSNASPAFGSSVTLTDTLPAVNGVYPTGTVTFLNGSTAIGTGTLSSSGVASLTTGALPVGTDSITAAYPGDTTFSGATSNVVVETVAKATVPSDVLTTSNATPVFGSSITITDTLAPFGGTYPTGTVTFYNGTTAIGTGTVSASGVATLSTSSLPSGTDTITAVYAGDVTFGSITSNAITETVGKASGANTLSTSNASPIFGSSVTLTDTLATIGGVAPTGTVTFYVGTTALGTGTVNGAGIGTLTTGALPVGTDSVTAVYGGDANYTNSTSNAVTESVSKASINSDLLTSSTVTPTFGQVVTFTDSLAGLSSVPPTGTVTFFDGTTALGTGTLDNTGAVTLSTGSLSTGSHTVRAVYAGDGNYNSVTSNLVTVTVGKIAATSNDTASGSGILAAATTPVTITIPYAGPVPPTGAVILTDTHGNSVTVAATSCTAAGGSLTCTANLPTANEPAGSNPVTVSQGADANYSGSTGTGTVTINKAGTTNGDSVTGTGTYGAATTAATVTIPYAGTTAPTGAITVADAHGNTLTVQASTCTASGKVLTCTLNFPTASEPVGANPATVNQAGDANYSGSIGSGTININKAPATTSDTATGTGTYGAATTPVTVTIPYAGTAAPTGAITLADTFGNTVTVSASSCTAAGSTLTCTTNLATANEPVGANAVTVNQAADANYSGSTGSGTVTIGKANGAGADGVTGTGSYGAATTPIKVTIPYAGATAPAGAITVTDTHGNSLTLQASSCTAGGGVLTCTGNLPSANEPAGANPATVSQAADANYGSSTGAGTLTINKAPATTGDTATGTGTYGAPTTPVTINIPYTGAAAPTGAITVSDFHGNTLTLAASSCTATANTLTCTANLPTATEPVGANPMSVSQAGDANYSGSTGTGTVTIGKAPATTTDSANGTGTYGAATTPVTVTIPYAGTVAPTGLVTVADTLGNTGTVQGASCTASSGTLTCNLNLPTANEPVGSNPVTVSQASDTNYSGSTGNGTVSIQQAGPTGGDTATGTGTYGAATTPITVVIPFTGATAPTGAILVADTLGNSVAVPASNCTVSGSTLVCAATLPTGNEPVGTNPVTVAQAADANHAASTGSGAITIGKAAATTTDTAAGSGTYGAPTTPVSVSVPYAGPSAPTGTVSVTDGVGNTASVAASVCSAANRTLTCVINLPTASEPLGANPVTVAQAGDANYTGSTGTGTVTISMATVSPVGSTSAGVQNVTVTQGTASTLLTATLSYSGPVAPTGAVTFTVSNGSPVTATCTSGSPEICTASYPTSALALGTYTITANEAADANYVAGSATGTLTVASGTVSPLLDTISNVSNVLIPAGTASTTLSASIIFNGPAPTGGLTFNLPGGTPVTATCTTDSSPITCTATYPTSSIAVGTYVITATEAADNTYPQGSATALLTVEANASTPTSPVLATGSSVSSVLVPYGTASTTLYSTIVYNGPAPTGAVTFTVVGASAGAVTGTCSTGGSPLKCTATYPTAMLGVGSYRIQVDEAADANYPAGSAIGTLTVTSAAGGTGDTVTGTGTYGAATTPITVTIPYTGSVAPTGDVTVTDAHGNTITVPASSCSAANNVLTCTGNLPTANVPAGTEAASVAQAADGNYAASTGNGSLTLNKAPVTSTDAASGTGTYGAPTTPVLVTIPYTGVTAPSGAVTVSDSFGNAVTVAASTCSAANSTLTCTVNLPTASEPVGNNPVTVGQASDANYSGSTGSGTITIAQAGPTGSDTVIGSGTYGAPTTSVNVRIPYTGAAPSTGLITLADTHGNTLSIPAASCIPVGGVLTCTANFPTANEPLGANPVTVNQAADANHASSTGSGFITINKPAATNNDTASGTGTYGAPTTLVTVTIPYSGAVPPAGVVTVADSLGESATVPASSCTAGGNTLTCKVNLPTVNEPAGANPVTVSQAADANYSGSTGAGTVTINKASAATDTVTGTGTYGTGTVAVTVQIPYTGSAPTGAITVADNHGNTLTVQPSSCTAAGGTLTCTVSLPAANQPVGTYPVTATQAGDGNHNASTGTGTVTLNKAAATTNDTATGTSTLGAATTPVTVRIPYAGAAAPTGSITVADTLGNTVTVPAASCTATAGILTCGANLPTANQPLGSHPVTVNQAADANYNGSTGSGTITITKAGASANDTATGTSPYGATSTPVTVTIPYPGSTVPTGAITLTDTHGNTVTVPASSCTSAKGVLTCATTLPSANEPVGSNPVTVTQAPDAATSGSTGTGTITVSKALATAADTATGTAGYGAASTPVTVSIPFAGATAPTGAITIADAKGNTVTVQSSSCTVAKGVLTCTANLPTANEPVGNNPLSITQAADANYSGSTGTGSLTVSKSTPTLTAPAVSPMNAPTGTPVTLTETVPPGETGTVTFFNGTTILGTATIANGTASLTTAALPQGTDAITATANGDSNYSAATSPAVLDTVGGQTAKVALTSSQNPATFGTSVTFAAAVSTSPATPVAGTVTFFDGTTALGTVTVSNGAASFSTGALSIGMHSVTATFTPAAGSTFAAVTSAVLTQTVQPAGSSIGLTSSQNPAIVGQPVTFTATVPTTIPGTAPTGTVTFFNGSTVLGTIKLNGSGVANFSTSTLSGGMQNITATYTGDVNYAASTSGVVAQGVSDYTVGSTTPTLGVDPGQTAAFNITINPASGVAFSAPVVLTVTGLPANATAAFAPGTLSPGTGGTTSTLTVNTFTQVLTAMEHQHHVKSFEAAALWACVFPLLGVRRLRRRLPKSLLMLALCVASFGVMAPLTGCGGGYFGPAPTSYTLTVTGTSGTLQRSTTVTLNIR